MEADRPEDALSALAAAAAPEPAQPARPNAPQAAPAPPAVAVRAGPAHYVPPKSNKGLYLGILFGFFALFLVVAAYLLFRYAGTKHVEIVDSYGNVIVSGRFTPEEAAKLQEKYSQAPEPNVVPQPTPKPAATVARRTGSGGGNPSLTGQALAGMSWDDPNVVPEVKALPEDPKIVSMPFEKILLPGSTDTGTIAGLVSNQYDSPLRDLEITPQIVDSKGRVIATLKASSCSFVPAHGTARYSAKFDGVPEDSIDRIRISAKAAAMEKGEVCYEVEDKPTLDWRDKSVMATGMAQNKGRATMADAFVHVDFYTREWIFIQSARGTITEDSGGRISAGKGARFKTELVLAEGEDPQRVQQALARVVGKEQ